MSTIEFNPISATLYERRRAFLDYLYGVSPDHFDMSYWAQSNGYKDPNEAGCYVQGLGNLMLSDLGEKLTDGEFDPHECGNMACAAGHMVIWAHTIGNHTLPVLKDMARQADTTLEGWLYRYFEIPIDTFSGGYGGWPTEQQRIYKDQLAACMGDVIHEDTPALKIRRRSELRTLITLFEQWTNDAYNAEHPADEPAQDTPAEPF